MGVAAGSNEGLSSAQFQVMYVCVWKVSLALFVPGSPFRRYLALIFLFSPSHSHTSQTLLFLLRTLLAPLTQIPPPFHHFHHLVFPYSTTVFLYLFSLSSPLSLPLSLHLSFTHYHFQLSLCFLSYLPSSIALYSQWTGPTDSKCGECVKF